jgi:hypothetical protein
MVNGLPGPMAMETAMACLDRGYGLIPFGFTGPNCKVEKITVQGRVKSVDVKFLRSLKKNLTSLKAKSVRVLKQKRSTRKASSNTNSGFLKPVEISEKMAKFTGWSSSEPRSRVDVTKHICKYIKDNNLQNPQDRREIIPDKTLCKLLDFDPKKDDKPLTYYRIQSYIKPHFIKPVVATA